MYHPVPLESIEPSCHQDRPREPFFKGDYSFNTGRINYLSTLDFVICIAALVVSTMIGVFVAWNNRRRMGIEDYLLAGREMNAIPVGLSIASTFVSGISLIGVPVYMYKYSAIFFWMGPAFVLGMGTVTTVFMPVFYQLRITSVYEYLQKRFSRGVRVLAASFFILWMLAYSSMVLAAPSISVSAVTGLSIWISIYSVGFLCILYTALGGMKAVIYTDAFQIVVAVVALIVMVVKADFVVGGWDAVRDAVTRTNRGTLHDFRLDPTVENTAWTIAIEAYFYTLLMFGVNQIQVHRYLCCRSLNTARRTLLTNVPIVSLVMYLVLFLGLYMSTFYENCDPKSAGLVDSNDQIMPLFVMDTMSDSSGLPGVFMAAVFCVTLSSVSSVLNSIATVVLEDLVRIHVKAVINERRARTITQVITVVTGCICLELTFVSTKLGGLVEEATGIGGTLASPLLGVFSLGMFFPWANEKGAFAGMIGGLIFNILITVVKETAKVDYAITCTSNCNFTAIANSTLNVLTSSASTPAPVDPNETNSFLKFPSRLVAAAGFIVTICLGMLVSYMSGLKDPKRVDPRLIVPVFDIIFPLYYLPERIREKLRFGMDHSHKWNNVTHCFRNDPPEINSICTSHPKKEEETNVISSAMPQITDTQTCAPTPSDQFSPGPYFESEV